MFHCTVEETTCPEILSYPTEANVGRLYIIHHELEGPGFLHLQVLEQEW